MAEEQDQEINFSSTNSLKEQQNSEQSLQNNFWLLAADTKCPEKQHIVFEGRGKNFFFFFLFFFIFFFSFSFSFFAFACFCLLFPFKVL